MGNAPGEFVGVCRRLSLAESVWVGNTARQGVARAATSPAWICRPEARFHAAGHRYHYLAEYICIEPWARGRCRLPLFHTYHLSHLWLI